MTKTLIIMPAWNEEEVIGDTIQELRTVLPDYDLLVVNDGSNDATVRVAEQAGAPVLSLPYRMGVGGAMRAGFKYARHFDYDQAIQVDADGQHDPREAVRVLAGLAEANISIGARFAGRGEYTVRGPRAWAMRFLAGIVSKLAHRKLTDITSGFRAADRIAIEQYCRHFPVEYLGDTIDSLVVAIRSGLTVQQIPVQMRPRQAGTPSHDPFKAALYLGRAVFSLLFAMTRRPVKHAGLLHPRHNDSASTDSPLGDSRPDKERPV